MLPPPPSPHFLFHKFYLEMTVKMSLWQARRCKTETTTMEPGFRSAAPRIGALALWWRHSDVTRQALRRNLLLRAFAKSLRSIRRANKSGYCGGVASTLTGIEWRIQSPEMSLNFRESGCSNKKKHPPCATHFLHGSVIWLLRVKFKAGRWPFSSKYLSVRFNFELKRRKCLKLNNSILT